VLGLLVPRAPAGPAPALARRHAVVAGLRQRAKELGYKIDEISSGRDDDLERIPTILDARGINGVLLLTGTDPALIERLHALGLHTVHTEYSDASHVDSVGGDPFQALALATAQLRALGHAHPGLILDAGFSAAELERWRCADAGLHVAAGNPWNPPLVLTPATPGDEIEGWLQHGRHDVVLSSDPDLVREKLAPLADRIFALGADVHPGHPGLELQFEETGRRAIDLLTRKVVAPFIGPLESPVRTVLPARWRSHSLPTNGDRG
jgi:DNA-binding LacI/PurR family transcriptional regulator